MGNFTKILTETNEDLRIEFSGLPIVELQNLAHEVMIKRGYKLTEGESGNGVYIYGSRVKRLLFGAFSKYFKNRVYVNYGEENSLYIHISRMTSGMSGGLIGMSQVKTEMKVLRQILCDL